MLMNTTMQIKGEPLLQAQVCTFCEVRRSALFGALDDAGLERVHARIDLRTLAPTERLYARGETGSALYTIRTGVVRFERVTEGGDRRIVRMAGRGDLIGQEVLLPQAYADEAIGCTNVELCRIPRSLVDELVAGEPTLMRELMRRWQQSLDRAAAWVADMTTGTARRRVLKLLAELQRHVDADDSIWLPRRDEMSAMLDMSVETASRMISRLRREGVLDARTHGRARVHPERLDAALQVEHAG